MVGGYRGRSPREREPGKRGRVEPWVACECLHHGKELTQCNFCEKTLQVVLALYFCMCSEKGPEK